MWSIRALSGPQTGQIFDLKMGKNTFGRGQNCDFKISSVGISKEHCEVHVYKDKVIIVDLKSSNGTFVNGVKIQNSIIKLGDKVGLFDVIMDVIPAPDIRPKAQPVERPKVSRPPVTVREHRPPQRRPQYTQQQYPMNGGAAMQAQYNYQQQSQMISMSTGNNFGPAVEVQKPLSEKIENYIEHAVMPVFYKLSVVLPFKQVLLGCMILLVVAVTVLSMFPLTTIMKESNFIESAKRAKSVARALARINEQALLSGQLNSLTVNEALKEDGIKEALIIQQSDGAVVAPTEKAGRENSRPFIAQARKESRSAVGKIDDNTIGASHPIGAYDPVSGETAVKYHAVVFYDVSSLNVDDGRIVSLLMQTMVIASLFGLMLYFVFARLIEHPLKQLNIQIDNALREKTDRTEILFDYPEMQKVVANVNLMLNRMWNGLADEENIKPQQNRDIEFTNMVDMIMQPAMIINSSGVVISSNYQFEQIVQMSKENLVQQNYTTIADMALVQNIEALIGRAQQSLFEKHQDRIPFSQFECEIFLQTFLDANGAPEYYFISLAKVNPE